MLGIFRRFFAFSVMVMCAAVTAHADGAPSFDRYPAQLYQGARAPLRLDTDQTQMFRTRLRDALKKPVNFGGRYVFTSWGAGTECAHGAVVNVQTGAAHFLPEPVCFWGENRQPFEFRVDSNLMVLRGKLGERDPDGNHYYEFTGNEFKRFRRGNLFEQLFGGSTDTGENVADADVVADVPVPLSRPSDADVEPSEGFESEALQWNKVWEISNKKPFDFILTCYALRTDAIKQELKTTLGTEKFEPYFVVAGGNGETAKVAFAMCDEDIRKLQYFDDEKAYSDAKAVFLATAGIMDAEMLAHCQSDECKKISKAVIEK